MDTKEWNLVKSTIRNDQEHIQGAAVDLHSDTKVRSPIRLREEMVSMLGNPVQQGETGHILLAISKSPKSLKVWKL